MRRLLLAMALCLGVLGTAKAQLGLPSLHLPSSLPTTLLPGGLQQSQPGLANDLDTSRPQDARRRIIRDLLHRYPRLLERDPHGEPIVRGELLVLSPSDAALAAAKAAGFSVLREEVLRGLGGRVLVLSVPAGMRTERALAKV